MSEERIQALVDRALLGSKSLLEWKAIAGQEFPTEDKTEAVIFAAFFERGFRIPTGDFFRGLLGYYKIELVHLNPNSILDIAVFIHLWDAFLGIPPHFNLWRYLYQLKIVSTKGKPGLIGGCGFSLQPKRVLEYFGLKLKDLNKGWHKEWFLITNQKPELPPRLGYAPVTMPEWSNQPTSTEMVQVKQLLKEIADLKCRGLTARAVSINFCRRLTQPIKDRVHPAYEYSGLLDPTRDAQRKVT